MEVPPALLQVEEVRCKPGMEEPVGEKEEREKSHLHLHCKQDQNDDEDLPDVSWSEEQ